MKFDKSDYQRLRQLYENKIQTLSEWIWQNKPQQEDITQWLENYNSSDQEREQLNALHQLSYFMSFELREIREMLRSLYRDFFIRPLIQILKQQGPISNDLLQGLLNTHIENTRFIGIGNASESSCLMLYFFRQENEIEKDYFINASDIFHRDPRGMIVDLTSPDIEHYIFIDDLAGSGSQAKSFFHNNQIKEIRQLNSNAKVYYFTLFNTQQSNSALKTYDKDIILRSIFELDETYKVFGSASRYYSKYNQEKIFSQQTCLSYLSRYSRQYPCGYNDNQLLLRFFYNTPDNTLPSFWSDTEHWKPVFKRYDKIY